jgi:transcriptional regulator with XRE-family HTH domain
MHKSMVATGVTPADLARRMTKTPKTIHGWLNGQHFPDIATLHRLGRELNVNPVWLAFGEESPEETRPSAAGGVAA